MSVGTKSLQVYRFPLFTDPLAICSNKKEETFLLTVLFFIRATQSARNLFVMEGTTFFDFLFKRLHRCLFLQLLTRFHGGLTFATRSQQPIPRNHFKVFNEQLRSFKGNGILHKELSLTRSLIRKLIVSEGRSNHRLIGYHFSTNSSKSLNLTRYRELSLKSCTLLSLQHRFHRN